MKKIIIYCLLLIVFCSFVIPAVRADYVLPYPSYMPGNKLYKVGRVIDTHKRFWYFGSIAQTKYHLGLSDKYLVEAKTLFEYKQYMLGADALIRSNNEFNEIPHYIAKAKESGIDVTLLKATILDAAKKHGEVLSLLDEQLPKTFLWEPEKEKPTELKLHDLLTASAGVRIKIVNDIALF